MKKTRVVPVVFVILIILTGLAFVTTRKNSIDLTTKYGNSNNEKLAKETEITLSELSNHNNESDCWMSIDGKVYDVTAYLKIHKSNKIKQGCGIDASAMYRSERKHAGREALLETMRIGNLVN